ncbi:hypothetical protein TREMEDRAFT_72820 [Tremella mesenterica DSM 1558]|uniref:uncharacterized protein n=1 Tax=Tremella mesenterica (strain ATCC 24925 / CBS 8224 / DSM 1558 / NBRC 9311 / NRRL Y-6157 / RJB 2259-6 / UBC 559-6) TaxID=578456 RepID=UPI0003F4A084|nr:uncharacterized protein TREMEDRAFT_72820 [Tremella mesenterica DSM 1558]EIW72613.1 hypothetical protein TREMEDRAFT_72820 [Tremella mesenterica DSM 1558]
MSDLKVSSSSSSSRGTKRKVSLLDSPSSSSRHTSASHSTPTVSTKTSSRPVRSSTPHSDILTMTNAGSIFARYLQSFRLPPQAIRPTYTFSKIEVHFPPPPIKKVAEGQDDEDPSPPVRTESWLHCTVELPEACGGSMKMTSKPHPGPKPAKRAAVLELVQQLIDEGKIDLETISRKLVVSESNINPGLSEEPQEAIPGNKESNSVDDENGGTNKHRGVTCNERWKAMKASLGDAIPPKSGMSAFGVLGMAQYPYHSFAKFWEDNPPFTPDNLHVTIIHPRTVGDPEKDIFCRPLCLLTTRPLPLFERCHEFEIEIEREQNSSQGTQPAKIRLARSGKIIVKQEDLNAVFGFTQRVLRSVLNQNIAGKLKQSKWLLAPLQPTSKITTGEGEAGEKEKVTCDDIAWEDISTINGELYSPIDLSDASKLDQLVGSIVCQGAEFDKRYLITGVRTDLMPSSPDTKLPDKTIYDALYTDRKNKHRPLITEPLQPILEAEALHSARHGGFFSDIYSPVTSLVIPETMKRYCIPPDIYRAATMIPRLMPLLDNQLLAREMNTTLFGSLLQPDLALEALSSPGIISDPLQSYERLEMLGDALLRLILTVDVHMKDTSESERQKERSIMLANSSLRVAAGRCGIVPYIRSKKPNVKDWMPINWKADPSGSQSCSSKRKEADTVMLGDKRPADVLEALIGAAYLSHDKSMPAAVKMLHHLTLPVVIDSWQTVIDSVKVSKSSRQAEGFMAAFQPKMSVLGYDFKDSSRADPVFSMSADREVRARFWRYRSLGDGILDFLVMDDIWHRYSTSLPGQLTYMHHSRLNDRALGAIVIDCGLADLIRDADVTTKERIKDFRRKMKAAQRKVDLGLLETNSSTKEYWYNVPAYPTLSDHLDAVFGAIWEDSAYSFEAVKKIYETYVRPLQDEYCVGPTQHSTHAKAAWSFYLQHRPCTKCQIEARGVQDGEYTSAIICHDRELVQGQGSTREMADRRACEKFLDRIKEDEKWLDEWCDCPAQRAKEKESTYTIQE